MITTLHSDLLNRIKGTWSHDPNLVDLIRKLQQPTSKPSKFTWVNGQLRRIGKLVVGFDDALRKELLHLFHSSVVGGTQVHIKLCLVYVELCIGKALKRLCVNLSANVVSANNASMTLPLLRDFSNLF